VTVFDATGSVVYASEGSDTAVAFPDSIAIVPDKAYLWKVDARTGFDRWDASELASLGSRVRGGDDRRRAWVSPRCPAIACI